jgi:hypothetical protein
VWGSQGPYKDCRATEDDGDEVYGYATCATIHDKITAFWDVAPCSLVWVDRRFRVAYCIIRVITSEASQKAVIFILYAVRTWNLTIHDKWTKQLMTIPAAMNSLGAIQSAYIIEKPLKKANGFFSNWGFFAANEKVISEWLIGKDLKGSDRGLISRHYPGIRLGGLRKCTRNLCHYRRSQGWDLNPGPPEHKAGVLTTRHDVRLMALIDLPFSLTIHCIYIHS